MTYKSTRIVFGVMLLLQLALLLIPLSENSSHGNFFLTSDCDENSQYGITSTLVPTQVTLLIALALSVIGIWTKSIQVQKWLLRFGIILHGSLMYFLYWYFSYHYVSDHEVATFAGTDSDYYIDYSFTQNIPLLLFLIGGVLLLLLRFSRRKE